MITKKEALEYHSQGKPGKLEIKCTKSTENQRDLSMAYTPGVAEPCLEIASNKSDVYKYTAKGNLVAVVTNGTAVLGLGNIGPEASKPVMEGKAVLFKRFADIDVFDIELNTSDPLEIIRCCQLMEPTFGGINLEDIKAPECFLVEETLRKTMKIPVFHDDQHGTAIISAAAMINAVEVAEKDIDKIKVVFSGAGSAGIACARLYLSMGVNPDNVLMVDSKGVLNSKREEKFNKYKSQFVRDTDRVTLADALDGADVFVGVSVKDIVTKDMVRSMAKNPIVLAMANPDPEISYEDAIDARKDVIMATGRSDYPNQVNNVLGFPYIFRGALDVRATTINEEMKIAAARALSSLARELVPEDVARAYGVDHFKFGREYLIPKPFDQRILFWSAAAVAQAAMDSGVAQVKIDIDEYKVQLGKRIGYGRTWMRVMTEKAKRSPKSIVFPEGESISILRSVRILNEEKIARPILLGNKEKIEAAASRYEIDLGGIEIINPEQSEKSTEYARRYFEKRSRKGVRMESAITTMKDPTYFGLMMLDSGDCDVVLSGATSTYPSTIRPALEIIDMEDGISRVAGMFAVIQNDKVFMFSDTTVNINPTAEELAEIAICSAKVAQRFNISPRIAMLSFSNFGSSRSPESLKVARATEIVKAKAPNLLIEGEMQADTALMPEYIKERFSFSNLKEEANVLIFPDLNSGNIAYKLVHRLGGLEAIGPILTGFSKPVHVLHPTLSVKQIVDMATIAIVDAHKI